MPGLLTRLVPRRFRSVSIEIPVVRLHGAIMSGGSAFRPMLSLASTAAVLEKAFTDKETPAVAISLNSPGGSPVQSRLIYRRIRDLAAEHQKKVFIFVEDVAASGGYMIALAGDEIIADPSSIVGSIGVVTASFGFPELLKKIGVERRVYTAGSNKVTLDPFQPEKKADIERLKSLQLEIHETFIDMVKERRGTKLAEDKDLFTGLFWTGIKGHELGLIDGLGDMRSFLRKTYGDKVKLKLVEQKRGLLGRKMPGVDMAVDMALGNLEPAAIAAHLGDGLLSVAEEKALWGRYGL
ncbi:MULTISPECIES: S49 family peptidase [Brucella]|uniref:Clp protease family protein n=1 Tax=Brucella lupini TaxID=255457 RepID=A0A256GPZ8_9HYPH|nr:MULTISPECIES: S49 family peptidase [Brucella/Ochrobactrum group]RNL42343.1 S49 family peptidase [Ochrobactrum sp. MH181795]KAB2703406.1 S49 family peptidase [Brucella lupini]KAB2727229.1 S49 family peptidase [Brucella anthropi]KAB2744390.1 S49 family peptidase [Brucella anthropi]KAB2794299.1 S49 family peptidase [Brucella anthropi]